MKEADFKRKLQSRTVTMTRGSNGKFGIHRNHRTILDVVPGSSAEKNGVKKGDQIVSINGVQVESLSRNELRNLFASVSGVTEFEFRHNDEGLKDVIAMWENAKTIVST